MGRFARRRLSRLAARLLALRAEGLSPSAAVALLAADGSIAMREADTDSPLATAFRDAAPSDATAVVDFVRACEAHGRGDDALQVLAGESTQRAATRNTLPLVGVEFAVLLLVMALYALLVLPTLKRAFDTYGATLPATTTGVFAVVTVLLPVMALAALALFVAALWWRTPALFGPLLGPLDRLALALPGVGAVLRRDASVRMAGWLGVAPSDDASQRVAVDAARAWRPGLLSRPCTRALQSSSGTDLAARLVATRGFDREFGAAVALPNRDDAQKALRAQWRLGSVRPDDTSPLWTGLLQAALGILVGVMVIAMYLPLFRIGTLN